MGEARRSDRTATAVPRFLKSKRRLADAVQEAADAEIKRIEEDPLRGEPKVGALRGVRVVKFKVGPQQYLLAYRFITKSNIVEMLDVGVHESFYRDPERDLEGR
jgi:mRNA-degrading endonuclease RelE of RelBE toxin-antitoxin system